MEAAFAGVKVLDLSRLLPGPFCSKLADLGIGEGRVAQLKADGAI